jgi:prophage regulatory protein
MQPHTVKFDTLPNSAFVRQKQIVGTVYPKSNASLWRDVKSGSFPKPIKLSAKCSAWRVGDIREWLASF